MRTNCKRMQKRRYNETAFRRHLALEYVETRFMLSANIELPITTVTDDDIASIPDAGLVDISGLLFAESFSGRLSGGSWTDRIFARSDELALFGHATSDRGLGAFRWTSGNVIDQLTNLSPEQRIQPITPIDLTPMPVGQLPVQTTNVSLSTSPAPTENSSSATLKTVPRSATPEPPIELVDITMILFSSAAVDPLISEAETTVATHDLFFSELENGRRANPVREFFAESHATAARSQDWQLDLQGSRGRAQAFEIVADTPSEAAQRGILPKQASHEAQATTQPSLGLPNKSPDLADASATHDARQQPMFLPIPTNDCPDVKTGATTEDEGNPPLLPKRSDERTSSTGSVTGAYRALAVIGGLGIATLCRPLWGIRPASRGLSGRPSEPN